MIPIQPGDKIKLRIEVKGQHGDPFGRHNGIVVFVKDKDVPTGSTVMVEATYIKERCVYAKIVEGAGTEKS